MKLSELKQHLNRVPSVNFVQTNGTPVPPYFHITEAGLITKHFIDCGGIIRTDKVINFQLWAGNDTQHRLESKKFVKIISKSEKLFGDVDLDVEVEYQTDTIGKFGLNIEGDNLILTSKHTDCLAKSECGVPAEKAKSTELTSACCAPGGGCC